MTGKFNKIVISLLLTVAIASATACSQETPTSVEEKYDFTYNKQSEELVKFSSSDTELDFFLNDYFKRHSGVVENGKNQSVNSVTAGVNALQFFWEEWNTMSYYWYNSRNCYDTDRIAGIRNILSSIPVDDYGYVWQESDETRDNLSSVTATNTAEHRMGWPFPTSYEINTMSTSWDFNDDTESKWTSEYTVCQQKYDADAKIAEGLFTTDVKNAESLIFTSPKANGFTNSTLTYFSPLLELDLRMYVVDSDNLEDIIVHYTTKNTNTGETFTGSVSVNEKAFVSYGYTPTYEHIIFLPMYNENGWKCDVNDFNYFVQQLSVEIKAKDGKTLDGQFSLNYVRSTFDTRHSNNNSIFISSLRNDFDYTGDMAYLKENITKARKAMNFYMQMYDADRHLNDQSYLVGHDSVKNINSALAKDLNRAGSLSNGYWDVSYMTKYDFSSNVYFYKALKDLAYLEEVLEKNGVNVPKSDATVKVADRKSNFGSSEYNYTSGKLYSVANDVLSALRKTTDDRDHTGFFSKETGRFVGGYSDAENKWYDYGYVMWNLEAVYYGVATSEQAKSIMDWVSGKRIVEKDKYGSQGSDIYFFEFAPRCNTYSEEDQLDISIFNGSHQPSDCYFGKSQVQNGGADMYVSFFDLTSRVKTYGADDAFDRLLAIKNWYMDVYDYYVSSDNYNVNPDRFYWDYYEKHAWSKDKTGMYRLQNGIKGTNERGGASSGVMGIDGEFLESFLTLSAVPYGFFGLSTANGNTLKINPSLPSQLKYWTIENLQYNDVIYDLTVLKNSVRIDSVRGNSSGIKVEISIDAPSSDPTVYVNGVPTSNYKLENGKITVKVPLKSVKIEVE